MVKIPKKVSERFVQNVKRYQAVLANAKSRDVGESDTVTIIVDILADVFGYDKYGEITSEHAIKGTFCDLAIKLDGSLVFLLEVKAIGLELKDAFVNQAVNYAANQGVEWVALTNGAKWRVYRVKFEKPINHELLIELDFATLNPKSEKDLESIFLLCKEGWSKSVLGEYHSQRQALSRFFLGNLILSDPVLQVIKRELRRLSPDTKVEIDEIRVALESEVLKRDVVEGDEALAAKRKIARAANVPLRQRNVKDENGAVGDNSSRELDSNDLSAATESVSPAS